MRTHPSIRWSGALLAFVILASCSEASTGAPTSTTNPSESESTSSPTAPATTTSLPAPTTAPNAAPLLDPSGDVDARDVTLTQMRERARLDLPGYQDLTIASDYGTYGSFSIAVPDGWLWWVTPGDPDPFIAALSEKDRGYAEAAHDMLLEANEDYAEYGFAFFRAAFFDRRSEHLVMVMVLLDDGSNDTVGSLVAETEQYYASIGAELLRLEAFPGEGGGSVESSALIPHGGEDRPRIQHQRLVFDELNQVTWGVLCDAHASADSLSSGACWTALRSFAPFGFLVGP